MSHTLFPWREAFLASLRTYPVVQRACDAVGIERSTAYRARKDDEDFARAWEDAMEAGIDRAEAEAFRRGVEGFEEPVVYQGAIATRLVRNEAGEVQYDANGKPLEVPVTVRKHSDMLLAKVLSARRAAYRTERTELTGADGGPVQMDATTRAARAAQLLEEARRRKAMADDFNVEDVA